MKKINQLPQNLSNELYYRAYGNHAYDTRKNGYAVKRLNGNAFEHDTGYVLHVDEQDYNDYLDYLEVHGGSYFENYPKTHTAETPINGRVPLVFSK